MPAAKGGPSSAISSPPPIATGTLVATAQQAHAVPSAAVLVLSHQIRCTVSMVFVTSNVRAEPSVQTESLWTALHDLLVTMHSWTLCALALVVFCSVEGAMAAMPSAASTPVELHNPANNQNVFSVFIDAAVAPRAGSIREQTAAIAALLTVKKASAGVAVLDNGWETNEVARASFNDTIDQYVNISPPASPFVHVSACCMPHVFPYARLFGMLQLWMGVPGRCHQPGHGQHAASCCRWLRGGTAHAASHLSVCDQHWLAHTFPGG